MNGTGVVSNFKYVDSGEVYSLGTILPAAATAVVGLRFYSRYAQKVSTGVDDWLILASLVLFIGCGICLIIGAAAHAMGYPTPKYPVDLYTTEEVLEYIDPTSRLVYQLEFVTLLLLIICKALIRSSAFFFFRRVLVVQKNVALYMVLKISIIITIIWAVACILLVIFLCPTHIQAAWGSYGERAQYCTVNGSAVIFAILVSDLVFDVYVIILPMPSIWRLQMRFLRKMAVTAIILLGLTSVASSLARLALYIDLSHTWNHLPDANQIVTLSTWWNVLEAGLALIAACLPALNFILMQLSRSERFRHLRNAFTSASTTRQKSAQSSKNHGYIEMTSGKDSTVPSSNARMVSDAEAQMDDDSWNDSPRGQAI